MQEKSQKKKLGVLPRDGKREFLLFSDYLLYCKKVKGRNKKGAPEDGASGDMLTVKSAFKLSTLRGDASIAGREGDGTGIDLDYDESNDAFRLYTVAPAAEVVSFVVKAETPMQRTQWVRTLKRAILETLDKKFTLMPGDRNTLRNMRTSSKGMTSEPLMAILQYAEDIEYGDMADSNKLDVSASLVDRLGNSELHRVAAEDSPSALKRIGFLIRTGARVDLQNYEGNTALHIAAGAGHFRNMAVRCPARLRLTCLLLLTHFSAGTRGRVA